MSPALAVDCASYFFYQEGNVPILLTSPHGASAKRLLPGVPTRSNDHLKRFVNRADQYTDQLTLAIAKKLSAQGLQPFVVVAGINRSQIDFNRPPEEAYEHTEAGECYRYYHQLIRQAIDEIRQRWHDGFMLDVHGQSKYDYDILRGTRNRQTIRQLLQRYGKDVTEEQDGFFTVLRRYQYHIHPAPLEDEQYYYGGFTLQCYGSHQANGLDALQVEIGREIRINHEKRDAMASHLAEAIERFFRRYYLSK